LEEKKNLNKEENSSKPGCGEKRKRKEGVSGSLQEKREEKRKTRMKEGKRER